MAKLDQPEHRLSHHVRELIDRIVTEPHIATAVDTGTYMHDASKAQRFAREEHRKWMGIVPHHLDWYIYGCTSHVYTQFELKYERNPASDGQVGMLEKLRKRGIPTGVFRTVIEVYHHLVLAGLHLHGNAENIAREIEARWRAADEAKRGTAPKKKRSSPRHMRRGVPPEFDVERLV